MKTCRSFVPANGQMSAAAVSPNFYTVEHDAGANSSKPIATNSTKAGGRGGLSKPSAGVR